MESIVSQTPKQQPDENQKDFLTKKSVIFNPNSVFNPRRASISLHNLNAVKNNFSHKSIETSEDEDEEIEVKPEEKIKIPERATSLAPRPSVLDKRDSVVKLPGFLTQGLTSSVLDKRDSVVKLPGFLTQGLTSLMSRNVDLDKLHKDINKDVNKKAAEKDADGELIKSKKVLFLSIGNLLNLASTVDKKGEDSDKNIEQKR